MNIFHSLIRIIAIISLSSLPVFAADTPQPAATSTQSVITEMEGYACMGVDHSRKETEQMAVTEARRKGLEYAASYIKSETHIKDALLEKDLVSAYAHGKVRVVAELKKEWYRDTTLGDCYRVQAKLEVIPREEEMVKAAQKVAPDDPAAPLAVQVWTDRKSYGRGEQIKVYLKANKPFYGTVVYRDAGGSLVQLLPNPYRKQNYFHGGTVYEIPSGDDRFDLMVTPPFGAERVTVYASTAPVGELATAPAGPLYAVREGMEQTAYRSRGVGIVAKGSSVTAPAVAEFTEAAVEVQTAAK